MHILAIHLAVPLFGWFVVRYLHSKLEEADREYWDA